MVIFTVGTFLFFFVWSDLELMFSSTSRTGVVCLVAVACHVTVVLTAVAARDWRDVGPDLEHEPSQVNLGWNFVLRSVIGQHDCYGGDFVALLVPLLYAFDECCFCIFSDFIFSDVNRNSADGDTMQSQLRLTLSAFFRGAAVMR